VWTVELSLAGSAAQFASNSRVTARQPADACDRGRFPPAYAALFNAWSTSCIVSLRSSSCGGSAPKLFAACSDL